MSSIFAMTAFALIMSVSPGPVNVVTLSSGLNFGIFRTLPFVSGATVGFTALLVVFGLGMSQIIEANSTVLIPLKYGGAIYILYMAQKIAFATDTNAPEDQDESRPSFLDGALLQWLNPKAWLACLSGVASFTVPDDGSSLLLFSTLYFVICFLGVGSWAILGSQVYRRPFINNNRQRLNKILGAGLALVALYLCLT